jgi:hypothetical protein
LQLFGVAAYGHQPTPSVVAAASNISVKGIYAGRQGRSGFAVLELDGKPVSAVVGLEFAPGMVLQRVYPDHVEILRNKQVETARINTASISAPLSAAPSAKPPASDSSE